MGVSDENIEESMKVACNRFSDGGDVTIYGVNGNYVNAGAFDEREKIARINTICKEYAYSLRRDLIKEASVLQDPEAVDVVLSLNFINEDSLAGYLENIEEMKRIQGELSKMLVASRMGLSELDEAALVKSIKGLSEVVEGLEDVKMAKGK